MAMKREYMLEKLTEELLTDLNNGLNPYKTCKKYLNMSMDVGSNHIKFSQINQPKRKPVTQMTQFGNFVEDYPSISDASRITGIPMSNISNACLGRNKSNGKSVLSAGGYKWKYKLD